MATGQDVTPSPSEAFHLQVFVLSELRLPEPSKCDVSMKIAIKLASMGQPYCLDTSFILGAISKGVTLISSLCLPTLFTAGISVNSRK